MVNISNPKAIVFLLAVLPQFLDLSKPQWIQYLIMAATMITIDLIVMAGYTGLASKVLRLLRSPRQQKYLNRGFAVMFSCAALLLSTVHQASNLGRLRLILILSYKITAKLNAIHKTILRPVEILSAALDHKPTLTPSWASTNAQITICFGEFANRRALKAGITSNAPISKEPTARKAKTVNKANNSIK